jgi:hypothetical protein
MTSNGKGSWCDLLCGPSILSLPVDRVVWIQLITTLVLHSLFEYTLARTAEAGARNIVYASVEDDLKTGSYVSCCEAVE